MAAVTLGVGLADGVLALGAAIFAACGRAAASGIRAFLILSHFSLRGDLFGRARPSRGGLKRSGLEREWAGSVADLYFGYARFLPATFVAAVAARAFGVTGRRCFTFRAAIIAGGFDGTAALRVGALEIVFLGHLSPGLGTWFARVGSWWGSALPAGACAFVASRLRYGMEPLNPR